MEKAWDNDNIGRGFVNGKRLIGKRPKRAKMVMEEAKYFLHYLFSLFQSPITFFLCSLFGLLWPSFTLLFCEVESSSSRYYHINVMYLYDGPLTCKPAASGSFLTPSDWIDPLRRPRGVELKNGIYYLLDATPAKNVILVSSKDALHLKELAFFLIWRYQKTYTREAFERLHGPMFQGFQDYIDRKRASLEGIPGIFNGIPFGDKQYKFKQTCYVNQSVPFQMKGANVVVGLAVDRVMGPSGNVIKNPKDMENAYKELKTIFNQEIDYMAQNPAFQQPQQPQPQSIVVPKL